MNLSIKESRQGSAVYLYLTGEVDAYTAPRLREVLIPLAERPQEEIIVNLEGVSYIDSTGLGIFIGALKATHVNKSTMRLSGVTNRIRRLFTITGLDEVIDIEQDKKEEAK